MKRAAAVAWAVLFSVAAGGGARAASAETAAPTSCVGCHGNADLVGDDAMVKIAEQYTHDVHAGVGLSCQDCHGGNPDPALTEDPAAAMDPDYRADPFRGAPARTAIPAFCGRCHSDPSYMKRFKPDARVDQESEYRTSQHGKLLARGDTKVATCIDCHGVHGILAAADVDSPVYPTKVAETCGHCHADPEHMAGYTLPDGRPLPVDQLDRWRRSVHANAMFEREDLTAPTCNDCHGNHGATPPGLDSIVFVCGQCHGREAGLFRASAKRAGLEAHNENYLAGGKVACSECHEPPEPQAALTTLHTFSECATCHGNHSVIRPTVALLAPLPPTPCALCHESAGALTDDLDEPAKVFQHYQQVRDQLLAEAATAGLEGDARFDWLVDRAQALPNHTEGGGEQQRLRPEFGRLFQKFRIGKTHFTFRDPKSGQEVEQKVVQCTDCHAAEPVLAAPVSGYQTAQRFLTQMGELTVLTARAERTMLAARRGGVEARDALLELDHAVDAQIELEVLVHTFSAEDGGAFAKKHDEGIEHARSALEAGRAALGELGFRRKGLAVSLGVILLVLVALGWKIRQIGQGG
jgi:hypothetical protein